MVALFVIGGTACAANDTSSVITLLELKQSGSKANIELQLVNKERAPVCFSALNANLDYPEQETPNSVGFEVIDFGRQPENGKVFVLAPGVAFRNTTVIHLKRVSDVDREEWLGFGDQEVEAKAEHKAFLRNGKFGVSAVLLTFKCPNVLRRNLSEEGVTEVAVDRYLGRKEQYFDLGVVSLRMRE